MPLPIRQRNARVEILQELLDRMRQVIAARAFQYANEPLGASGMMVKDYRGKNGETTVWRVDAALNAQMLDLLEQVAIEEGQWGAQPETGGGVTVEYLRAARQRVADAGADHYSA